MPISAPNYGYSGGVELPDGLVYATNVSNLAQDNAWTSEGQIVFKRSGDEIWVICDDGTNERRIFSLKKSALDSEQW